jgi:hypothetical protein
MTPLDRDFLKDCAFESTKGDYENFGTLAPEMEKCATEEGRAFDAEILASHFRPWLSRVGSGSIASRKMRGDMLMLSSIVHS